MRLLVSFTILTLVLALPFKPAAQHSNGTHLQGFGICKPVSDRVNNSDGCWIVADQPIGKMPATEAFWYLDQYPTESDAYAAKSARGAVLNAHGAWWLLTVEARGWRPAKPGNRISEIGPLPVAKGESYSALYLDATMEPGTNSAVHRHPGPEAWYTLSGETCLETPKGKEVQKPGGQPLIVPEGTLMRLTASGNEKRRALTLLLHRSTEPPTIIIDSWKPKDLCHR